MYESIGDFGDVRRSRRGAKVFGRIVRTGSLVQRKVGGDRAGEIAMDRFLSCEEVTKEEILETLTSRTAERCKGRRIVLAQDTVEVNFSGSDLGRRGLGPAGNGKSKGFFIHAAVAVDVADDAVVGLASAEIWTRQGKVKGTQWKRRFATKESARWLRTAETLAERFKDAGQVIVVGDRESDIYGLFAHRPQRVELLVRANQNRVLAEGKRLFEEPREWSSLGTTLVPVIPRKPGEKMREAKIQFRAGIVRIRRPRTLPRTDPEFVELTLVEAYEANAPAKVKPIQWRLLTTLSADTAEAAAEVVQLYRRRWRIEQTFRALKNHGLQLPDVQMQRADKLFKLAAMAIGAAVRILQLVDARHGSRRPAADLMTSMQIDAVRLIAPTLEGKTQRQQNPHEAGSLAWLAWVAARLGGWNCYYKPPGPKTMADGWNNLMQRVESMFLVMQHHIICTRDV
jgi:hypothetical protein